LWTGGAGDKQSAAMHNDGLDVECDCGGALVGDAIGFAAVDAPELRIGYRIQTLLFRAGVRGIAASMRISAADRACSRGEVSFSEVARARPPSKSTASW
jgi:hypothetical protein